MSGFQEHVGLPAIGEVEFGEILTVSHDTPVAGGEEFFGMSVCGAI